MKAKILLALSLTAALWNPVSAAPADPLADAFSNPPDAAKPWVYWWWLDSFATKEGITRDLEEMKRQGIAGALVFDAGEGGPDAPKGDVFMGDAWRELFRHAIHEANRIGIALSVNICSGWNAGGTWIPQEHAAKRFVWSSATVTGPGSISKDLPKPDARENYYRDIAVLALPGTGRPADATPLKHLPFKAARIFLTQLPETLFEEDAGTPGERDCESQSVIDITGKVNASGKLTWDAPAGEWTILRVGYTLLGAKTSCPSPRTQGNETDFFSEAAMNLHWMNTGAKLIADAGPLAGKTLQYVHDDSYEVAGPDRTQQNWTPKFHEEFQARRGYDPLPYLPVLAGKIVDNREISNRFLWDYRRTIGDLFATHHYRRMSSLAKQHNVGTHPESGGPFWPYIDALELEGINDIPMGEYWKRAPEKPDGKIFWADNYHICDTVKQAASAAHIYGKKVCQAEAFTSMGPNWEEDFYDMKDIADEAFCRGLTRNMLCFYVHQGKLDAFPGYQWEAAGTHFDRNVTWWNQIHAFNSYLSRCQTLLQHGLFVADVCYFYGDDVPNYVPARHLMRPALPKGYDCDTINADVLLNRMSVRDGRLVLPDGMSYRLLVLPQRTTMSPHILKKIKDLVEAGATVVGPRPERSPGLGNYPKCDEDIRSMADTVWADVDGVKIKERKAGNGRVIAGKSLAEIFAGDALPPDFEYRGSSPDSRLDYIHRRSDAADIYFVANLMSRPEKAECIFRTAGRQPEIWDAVTGERRDAADFRVEKNRTVMPLEFASRQSWFVVFRKPSGNAKPGAGNFPTLTVAGELTGPWTVQFDPKWGGPASITFDTLQDWTKRAEPGIRHYSGKAVYRKTFDLPESLCSGGKRVFLDLGRIKNVAEVRLNGKNLGVVWTAPWRVDISAAVQPAGNRLEIDVVNLWPNRLIGDAGLPPEQRITATNVKKFKKDMPLMSSGLLGPVTLQTAVSP